jgi:predicted amidohydrolase
MKDRVVPSDTLRLALITEIFHDDPGGDRLTARLREARESGCRLAVLPELPLNRWAPVGRIPSDDDAEAPGGRRQELQSAAAAAGGIAVLGGAIVRDPTSGIRHNTALLYDERGTVVNRYRKLHLPEEEGFWETSHYEPGDEPPTVVDALGVPVGVQLCSDVNRPWGCNLLGAQGAVAILAPRATAGDTWDRWRLVLRADAVTSCAYVVSVNRPGGQPDFPNAGPTVAIAPDGTVLLETRERLVTVEVDAHVVAKVRREYPGYLPVHTSLYGRGWSGVRPEEAP